MNILCPAQRFNGGSAFQRVFLPMTHGAQDKAFQCLFVKDLKSLTDEQYARLIGGTDIYYQGTMARWADDSVETKDLDDLIGQTEERTKWQVERIKAGLSPLLFVSDYDDWNFDIPSTSTFFVFGGLKDCVVEFDNGEERHTIFWKDRESRRVVNGKEYLFDTAANKIRLEAMRAHMRNLDALTTTTEYLARKLREYNDNVYVLPNGIDFDLYEHVLNKTNEVRIGYMYSASHFYDWLKIAPVIRDIVNNNIGVKLVLMGNPPPMPQIAIDPGKVEIHPYVNYTEGYHAAFSALRLDIGLCPLLDNEFNKCKSPLKWQEYSAVKAVTVAPNILYGDYIGDGRNGFIYHDMRELKGLLNYIIKRPDKRKQVAENAYAKIRAEYDIKRLVPKYKLAFEAIIKKGVEKYEKISVGAV